VRAARCRRFWSLEADERIGGEWTQFGGVFEETVKSLGFEEHSAIFSGDNCQGIGVADMAGWPGAVGSAVGRESDMTLKVHSLRHQTVEILSQC
jgi:hypothetical protein